MFTWETWQNGRHLRHKPDSLTVKTFTFKCFPGSNVRNVDQYHVGIGFSADTLKVISCLRSRFPIINPFPSSADGQGIKNFYIPI